MYQDKFVIPATPDIQAAVMAVWRTKATLEIFAATVLQRE
jgi:hypothetical protein